MTIIPLIPLSDLKNNDALTEYKEDDKNYWWDFHFISKLLMPSKEDIIDDFIKKTTDKYIKSISNVSTLKTLMFPENIEPEKKQPEEAEAKKQQAEADDKKLLHEIGQTVIDDVLIAGLEKNWKEYKKTIIEKAINNIKYKNQLFWERIQFWNDREVTNPKPDISQYFILSDNCGMDILQSLPEGSCTISLEQDENQYNEKRQINNIKKVITATTDCNHSTKVNKLEPLLNGNTLQKIFPKITNVAINTPQAIQDTIEADNLNNFLVEDPEYVKKIKTNINNYITNNEKNNPCNESIECLKLILLELENIKGKTALIELVKKAEEIIAAPAQQPAPVQQPAPQP
jgi:hypothetical protein